MKTWVWALVLGGLSGWVAACGGDRAQPAAASDLVGSDRNGDGIRDDVEAYIDKKYKDSERTRAAVRQYAKSLQATMEVVAAGDDRKAHQVVAAQAWEAMDCLSAIAGVSRRRFRRMVDETDRYYFNTPARYNAYLHHSGLISGASHTLIADAGKACEYERAGGKRAVAAR